MGLFQSTESSLTSTELEEYQDCTFFTKKEILYVRLRNDINIVQQVHKKFRGLANANRVGIQRVMQMDELKENPFRERICRVFAEDPTSGDMTFDDFLDMMSVFSEEATREVKASYAFRIYDMDGDGYLDKNDIMQTLVCLCGRNLKQDEVSLIADKVLEEADLDSDHRVSYVEFEHIISRSPDFVNTFRIRL